MYQAGGAGVAFVSPDNKSKGMWPVCHAYSVPHEDGWEKCHHISKKIRANIGKLIKAGTFDNKSGSSGDNTLVARTSAKGKPAKKKRAQ